MSNVISVVSILRPGLQTTVQDLGRWGWQARGVPVAGAMDWRSHRLANALVGNDQRTAALEIALIGPELEFADDRALVQDEQAVRDFCELLEILGDQEHGMALVALPQQQFAHRCR